MDSCGKHQSDICQCGKLISFYCIIRSLNRFVFFSLHVDSRKLHRFVNIDLQTYYHWRPISVNSKALLHPLTTEITNGISGNIGCSIFWTRFFKTILPENWILKNGQKFNIESTWAKYLVLISQWFINVLQDKCPSVGWNI